MLEESRGDYAPEKKTVTKGSPGMAKTMRIKVIKQQQVATSPVGNRLGGALNKRNLYDSTA